MHIMQDGTLYPINRQYLHAPLICRGALCRIFHQPGKHPPYTQVLGCECGRATRMVPDASTEKTRDKIRSRFNSRQAVRSNPFMSKEALGGGKLRQQNRKLGKSKQKKNHIKIKNKTGCSLAITTSVPSTFPLFLSPRPPPPPRFFSLSRLCLLVHQQRFSYSAYVA